MLNEGKVCKICKSLNTIITELREGQSVCFECGYVLEEGIIDDSAEWRTFSDSAVNMERTEKQNNPYFKDGAVSLVINGKKRRQFGDKESRLKKLIRTVERYATQLEMSPSTIAIAKDISDMACKRIKRFSSVEGLVLAIIYLAARKNGAPIQIESLKFLMKDSVNSGKKVTNMVNKLLEFTKVERDEISGLIHSFGSSLDIHPLTIQSAVIFYEKYKLNCISMRESATVAGSCLALAYFKQPLGSFLNLENFCYQAKAKKLTLQRCIQEIESIIDK